MKVKEIIEILNASGVNESIERLVEKLDNIGIENATEETDVPAEIVKKFSKSYKVDIKPIKAKKPVKEAEQINKREEAENQTEGKFKAENSVIKEAKEEKAQKEAEKEQKVEKKENQVNNTDNQNKSQTKNDNKNNNQNKPQNKPQNKKQEIFDEEKENLNNLEEKSFFEDKYEGVEKENNQYKRIKNVKNKKNNKQTKDRTANLPQEKSNDEKIEYYTEGMTVAKVADALHKGIGDVVRKLVMLGYMASATDVLDRDAIELIVEDFGYQLQNEINSDITKFEEIEIVDDPADLEERPPIVTIMGHVDHGKTTLLDTIRNSKITSGEAGGITQAIGAYQVKKNGKLITFIDTPGHAAFTEMRARGANITDIVILVVAADDGVMPQTKEAIEHAKAAKVPIIVAVNKMDKPTANPDRIKEELAKYDLLCEEWGGNTIFCPISALKGTGVDNLLEMVLLVSEMNEYKANPNRLATGTVIEAKLD